MDDRNAVSNQAEELGTMMSTPPSKLISVASGAAASLERPYRLKCVTGNSNRPLAEAVAKKLGVEMCPARVGQFANGEIDIKILGNVRGDDVFVLQPTCASSTTDLNTSVMELLLLIHTLRLASAKRITAVVPHFAYARQDRKTEARVPISASAVAQLLMAMSVDRVVTVDLHCGQIQGFFHNTPVDNLYGYFLFSEYFKMKHGDDTKEFAIVAPDAGAVEKARNLADKLSASHVVTILKRRVEKNKVDSMQIVGDVQGRACIIVDDMIDTAGTMVKGVNLLRDSGATDIYACCTHGIFSDPACERLNNCDALKEMVVTDSIPQELNQAKSSKIKVISLAPLLAKAIRSVHEETSLSSLFHRTVPSTPVVEAVRSTGIDSSLMTLS
jgi:ribose-phosphate pyrophosphokinase|eukprot:CAMPEP_0174301260 /NCGR_PEP_ID=MMETSP0809-20121228/58946_1 /TAXON_ID=73025 ORGANISM="Eutreptiella gymnastica-like, Strain CCMP1594" /NCGR_SAMPLE_ID=MMETSP0809 /ASSEMBLY_ACC=CAM_ASM_000658 /LENGTH=385 /DNA_ID=CAMNT_0015406985 /DNA_START=22 /DNA_END=1179 /DNA_ORIENTATION=-